MNERIRELAEQAGWMMGDEVEGFNTRLEKFAELIVRECVGLCNQWPDTVRQVMSRQIKEHFGVEE